MGVHDKDYKCSLYYGTVTVKTYMTTMMRPKLQLKYTLYYIYYYPNDIFSTTITSSKASSITMYIWHHLLLK